MVPADLPGPAPCTRRAASRSRRSGCRCWAADCGCCYIANALESASVKHRARVRVGLSGEAEGGRRSKHQGRATMGRREEPRMEQGTRPQSGRRPAPAAGGRRSPQPEHQAQGAVVGAQHLGQQVAVVHARLQRLGDQEVVQPPAPVVGARVEAARAVGGEEGEASVTEGTLGASAAAGCLNQATQPLGSTRAAPTVSAPPGHTTAPHR